MVITCSRHNGTNKDAHEHILSALDTMCKRCGLTIKRKNVTSSRGSKKKGDLEICDINLAEKRNLVIDVALVHELLRGLLARRAPQRAATLR